MIGGLPRDSSALIERTPTALTRRDWGKSRKERQNNEKHYGKHRTKVNGVIPIFPLLIHLANSRHTSAQPIDACCWPVRFGSTCAACSMGIPSHRVIWSSSGPTATTS
jgi:hypothetical protein